LDILTHTLSGIAGGTMVTSFSGKGAREKFKILCFSGLGGAFPDIDAISLWSKFDNVFGKFFGLNYSGEVIYFSKFWYSHHGFFHSIVASVLFALLFGFLFHLTQIKFVVRKQHNLLKSLENNLPILLGFILGFIIHLFEDMPTPSCYWGGVRLFFPFEIYVGGTGKIWWWNNYDIFLIILSTIFINSLFVVFKRIIRFDIRKLTISVFIISLLVCVFQIKTRNYNFNYTGQTSNFQQYETKSKEIQRQILGERVFTFMSSFDQKLKINL